MAKEYIEREALRLAYERSLKANTHNYVTAKAIHSQEHRHMIHVLDKIPAADVVEVKHGYWIEVTKNMSWKCSECGELSCCKSNFCHNCGADMRERRDNNDR